MATDWEHRVAVLGGDGACLRAVASAWIGGGRGLTAGSPAEICELWCTSARREVRVRNVQDGTANVGPSVLVWALPERSATQMDLVELRCAIRECVAQEPPALIILICVSTLNETDDIEADLDGMQRTLSAALDFDQEFSLAVVSLLGDDALNVRHWLTNLDGYCKHFRK